MRSLALVILLVSFLATGCPGEGGGHGDDPPASAPPPVATDAAPPRPRAKIPDREERQRRSEAVRRATVELAIRGVDTRDYLMNLIAEGDDYRVAFVRRTGRTLDADIRVLVRGADFEILSIEGLPDAGAAADDGG